MHDLLARRGLERSVVLELILRGTNGGNPGSQVAAPCTISLSMERGRFSKGRSRSSSFS